LNEDTKSTFRILVEKLLEDKKGNSNTLLKWIYGRNVMRMGGDWREFRLIMQEGLNVFPDNQDI
jgi:hypothetical protein